ncbi:MAG: hypothetical protein ACTSRU_09230, partial [Candidatus Hodarchaeales archaeon]
MENRHTGPRKGYKHQNKVKTGSVVQKRQFKKKNNPLIVPAIIIIAVVGLVGFASITNFGQVTTGDQSPNNGENGDIAGDFVLQDVNTSSEFKMSDYKGSLILLDFMATW